MERIGLFIKAIAFAAAKHSKQRRKDEAQSPYINHPIALATALSLEGGVTDTAVLCAAILHDTLEDTATTYDELVSEFGVEISSLVLEMTDDKGISRDERKKAQVEKARSLSKKAKLVKIADKISNLRDILNSPPKGWSQERKQEYCDWAKSLVDQISDVNPGLSKAFYETYGKLSNSDIKGKGKKATKRR